MSSIDLAKRYLNGGDEEDDHQNGVPPIERLTEIYENQIGIGVDAAFSGVDMGASLSKQRAKTEQSFEGDLACFPSGSQ